MVQPRTKRILGVGTIVILGIYFANRYYIQSRNDKLFVGTWSSVEKDVLFGPKVIHLFPNHTYTFEGISDRTAKEGAWFVTSYPVSGRLILERFTYGTDTVADGRFDLDASRKVLNKEDGFIASSYAKLSSEPQIKSPENEKFILGHWFLEGRKDKSHEEYFFTSDHQFLLQFEEVGRWRISGSEVILDWIDDSDNSKQSSTMKIDRSNDSLKNAEGGEFHRMKS